MNTSFNADPDRLFAAHWVLHMSILTAFLSIMTTPYDAVIIAHERMDFYAYMSIVEGILKLLIVFLLYWCPGDKLIYYAILNLLIATIVRSINAIFTMLLSRYLFSDQFHFIIIKQVSF